MSLDYSYFVGLVETFTSIVGLGDGVVEGGIYSTKGGVTTRYSMIAGLFSD